MLHVLPSQCSISGVLPPDPTAQASVADTAATETRPARNGSPAGEGSRVQEVPLKCSITLVPLPVARLVSVPTAHPSEALLNPTPASRTSSPAGTGAVRMIDHRVPSKCSASGTPRNVVVPALAYPTAHASAGLTAATETRSGPDAPAGLGLGTVCSVVAAEAAGAAASRTADSRPAATGAILRSLLTGRTGHFRSFTEKWDSCPVHGHRPGSVQQAGARSRNGSAEGDRAAAARPWVRRSRPGHASRRRRNPQRDAAGARRGLVLTTRSLPACW